MSDFFYVNEKRIAAVCLLEQISAIRVFFEGKNGSGQIDRVLFFKNNQPYVTKAKVTVIKEQDPTFNLKEWQWENPPEKEELVSLEEAVTEHVYQALKKTKVNWFINDGGFGHWRWDPQNGIDFKVYQRVVTESLEYVEKRKLGYPEEHL